ncbi:MAG: SDR family oxidoreductase [Leptospiraceae bacterium]|nr:SDR family oxidoreductase [Leptospiraceae bacterium]MDW7976684.1 SDR family oxidoreductase [Leptospiraceae bacterium]
MNYQRAVILGATSDMAYAFCKELGTNKINLTLLGRNQEKLEKIKNDLFIRYHIDVQAIPFDIEKDSIETVISQLPRDFQIFACFVGYLGDQQKAQSDPKEAERIIRVNYTLPSLFTERIVELLKAQNSSEKVIIGVSSVAGDRGRQSNYFYGSAKAGYTAYLSGLRNRLFKENIHVMTVKPGFVRTAMTAHLTLPKLLTAEPEEVAKDIYHSMVKKKNVLYTKWFWKYIMLIIRHIPEGIFKKLSL